jgi:uncharacterized protein YktA (UPF0223 family)
MYYLGIFIDDERDPHQVTWVTYPDKIVWHDTIRTYKEFKKFLTLSKSDKKKQTTFNDILISFDHDLQDFDRHGNESTGFTCMKWLCDYLSDFDLEVKDFPQVVMHSQNPVGAKNILEYYNNFKRFVDSN